MNEVMRVVFVVDVKGLLTLQNVVLRYGWRNLLVKK